VVLDFSTGDTNPNSHLSSHEPALESLSITVECTFDNLPNAPRLRRLYLDCIWPSPRVSFLALSGPQLAGLTNLVLYTNQTPRLLRALPAAVLAQLRDLTIVDDLEEQDFIEENAGQLFTFSNLCQLNADDACWLAHIRAPKLVTLVLQRRNLDEVSPHLANFISVTHLQLYGTFSVSIALLLQCLNQITTLSFSCPKALYPVIPKDYSFTYEVFSLVAETKPPLWSRLHTIQFLPFRPDFDHCDESIIDDQDLINFVRTRNSLAAKEPGTVARIERVVASHPGASDWLNEELLRLTQATE